MENQEKFMDLPYESYTNSSNSKFESQNQNLSEMKNAMPNFQPQSAAKEELDTARKEFDDVIQTARNVDANLANIMQQNRNLIQRVFPGKMRRIIDEKERLLITTTMDFRVSLLKLGNQTRLEAMRDKYDVFLKMYKGHHRAMLTEFLIQKLKEVYGIVKREEIHAFHEIEGMYDNAQTLRVESLKQRYLTEINLREGRLMQSISKTLSWFEHIIDERLEI